MAVVIRGADAPDKDMKKKKRQAAPAEDIFAEFRDDATKPATGGPIGERLQREQAERAVQAARGQLQNMSAGQKALNMLFGVPALVSLGATLLLGFFGTGFLEELGLMWVLTALFGSAFFFLGMTVTASSKTPFGLIFVLVGGVIAGVSLVYGLGSEELQEHLFSNIVPLLAMSAFPLCGSGCVIGAMVQSSNRKKKYTVEVQGIVIDKQKVRSRHRDGDGNVHTSTTYPLSWKYVVNGKEYLWRNNSARSPEKRGIGDTGMLKINPDDPRDALDPAVSGSMSVFLVVFGIIFAAAGILGMASLLMA